MRCPYCGGESRVIDTRDKGQGIRRYRQCLVCQARFITYEHLDSSKISVIKKDHCREAFNREKLLKGICKACEKRLLPSGAVEKLVSDLEFELHLKGRREVPSSLIGEMVMERLLRLDQIAYIRFASVYRAFTDIGSLKKEVDSIATRQLPLMSEEEIQSEMGGKDDYKRENKR